MITPTRLLPLLSDTHLGRSRTQRTSLDYIVNNVPDHDMVGADGYARIRLMNTTFDYKASLVGRNESDGDIVLWDDAWIEKSFWIVSSRSRMAQDQHVSSPPVSSFVFSHEGTSGFVKDRASERYRIKKVKTVRFTKDSPFKHIRIRIKWPKGRLHEYNVTGHGTNAYYPPVGGRRMWLFIKTSYQYRRATIVPPRVATWTTTHEHMQLRTSFKQIPG